MKKYFSTREYSKAQRIRERKSTRQPNKKLKKHRKNLKYLKRKNTNPYPTIQPTILRDRVEIPAPSNFSLLTNTEKVLEFFDLYYRCRWKRQRIFLDLSNIELLSPETLLYLLAQLEYFHAKGDTQRVEGNLPTDQLCRDLFVQSGFLEYVRSKGQKPASSSNVVSIRRGTVVDPRLAEEVLVFSQEKLGISETQETSKIYKIIIECMTNSKNHAYHADTVNPKWYLIALYDMNEASVKFSILDTGSGIPATIQKKGREKIIETLSDGLPNLFKLKDSSLILSALRGELRSRTRESYRGLGLPSIREIAQSGLVEDLRILSRRGYVNCTTDECKEISSYLFHGTLVTWTMKGMPASEVSN